MAKAAIVFKHEKLGEITLKANKDGRPVYDSEKVIEIFGKGVEYLFGKELLSKKEKAELKQQINASEISLIHNLNVLIKFNYQYHRITGEVRSIFIEVDDNSQYIGIERMINDFLDVLCQVVVTVVHKESNVKNQNSEYKTKGEQWEKYAAVLIPEEEVISNRFYNKALDYLTNNIPEEQIEKLKEICRYNEIDEDDWVEHFVDDYVIVVMSDLDNFGEEKSLTPKDYIEDQIWVFEDDKRIAAEREKTNKKKKKSKE